MWIGLIVGFVLGFVIGATLDDGGTGFALGVGFGFIGWLIGLIRSSARNNKQIKQSIAAPAVSPAMMAEGRIAALEARVSVLEARLQAMAGGQSWSQAAASVQPPEGMPPEAVPPEAVPPEVAPPQGVPPVEEPAAREAAVEEPAAKKPPPPPREPPKPNPIIAWFTGGNAIARIGVVVLFIGLAFLLRYSIEAGLVPPELRVAGIGFAGLVLLVIGFRLRNKKPGYALSLQGAGVGILYLTVFGALRLYHLIPGEAAFPLLVIIAALATVLAVKQDSAVLAGFGAAGGFIAPVLASTGKGDHVMLFGYFTVLNAAILTTAVFKRWRSLNLIGFVFTFLIAFAWGANSYKPQHFATAEPFLIIFFLMYVAVAILFARHAAPTRGDRAVDGTIVFGAPLVGFGLQSAMLRDTELGLAISAVVLAAFYLVLTFALYKRGGERMKLLAQAFLALGVVFITVAIPLAFDARWTAAAWAVEGAAVLWMGARQGRWVPVAFGTLVQMAGAVSFASAQPYIPRDMLFVNGSFLGFCMLAAAGLFSNRALRYSEPDRKVAWLRPVYFIWGLLWWLAGVAIDLDAFLPDAASMNGFIAIVAASVLALARLHRDGRWPEAAWPSNGWMPLMFALFFLSVVLQPGNHLFANLGWLVWTFAFAAHFLARRAVEGDARDARGYAGFSHWGAVVLMALIGAVELRYATRLADLSSTAWSAASLVVIPCVLVLAVTGGPLSNRWPVSAHPHAYRILAALPILEALLLWIAFANFTRPGPSTPLPYIPLLNAIDLAHGLIALTALAWYRKWGHARLSVKNVGIIAGIAAFAWANGILLRSLHHWADVPYNLDAWMRSFLAQASFSIFWSVLALGTMVYATRTARRTLWMVGAALMGVVVVKLALVDFARLGGLERIASFIGVGVLMLVVGYFSPVPPKKAGEAA